MRQMDVPIGRVVYTPVLAHNGGFKSDLTVMRLAHDHFRVVTGGAHGMADIKWFRDHLPEDGTAQLTDLTSAYTTLGIWGPNARTILSSITGDDVSHAGFKFGTCRVECDSLNDLFRRKVIQQHPVSARIKRLLKLVQVFCLDFNHKFRF